MLKSSAKIKKSRGGQVFKDVKEHYLRKEIPCGIKGCVQCASYPNIEKLDLNNVSISNIYEGSHILMPELQVIIKNIDIFENEMITNVILLESVVNIIKAQNFGIYKRIQNIMQIPEKSFYIFNNEHHIETFSSQNPNESHDEWQCRLFYIGSEWYILHTRKYFPDVSVIVLCEEMQFLERKPYFVEIYDYVKSLIFSDELIDSLSSINTNVVQFDISPLKSINSFPEHLTSNVINLGLKISKYLCGIFYQNREDYTTGTVRIRNSNDIYYVRGIININRSFTDDLVAVEIVNEIPAEEDCVKMDLDIDFNIPCTNNLVQPNDDKKYCRVVGIIRRNWRQYSGSVLCNTDVENVLLFKPSDSRYPFIFFKSSRASSLLDKKICLSVDDWSADFRYPKGHLVKVLGDIGDKDTETNSILFDYRIPYQMFSSAVLDCLPKMNSLNIHDKYVWDLEHTIKNHSNRIDLRHLNIYSIDPPKCTDIDDALHIQRLNLPSGTVFEVGIHIADVTHYVNTSTALDKEAYRRGTSVYLVDRRIDMLPELLSTNICSLRPNVDRLAFSVLAYFDEEGNLLQTPSPIFTKSLIRSKRAFTYAEAQSVLDQTNYLPAFSDSLKTLRNIMTKVREKRINRGALQFDSPEVKFEMESESQDPIDLETKTSFETNKIVEECMLLANVLVAKKIYESFPNFSVLRRHPRPTMSELKNVFQLVSRRLSIQTPIAELDIASFLKIVNSQIGEEAKSIVGMMCIRCLQQASYISSGSFPFESFYHFGLAESIYTHFTSPIRRYPDIIVHRLLASAIGQSDSNSIELYDSNIINHMCNHLNRRHILAQIAGRQSIKLHFYYFIKKLSDEKGLQKGFVTKIHKNAISIYIPAFHHECFAKYCVVEDPMGDTDIDFEASTVSSKNTGIVLNVFDQVVVQFKASSCLSETGSTFVKIVKPPLTGF